MAKFKRYRVAHMFTHEGVLMTNDHEAEIRALPREVRDHHIELGNLEEYESDEAPPGVAAAAERPSTTKTKE